MAALLNSSLMVEGTGSEHEDGRALRPDPEVAPTARRRRFSGAEKRRILAEADRCTKPGEIGALMRREGIYSSMLATWRRQRDQAHSEALAPQKRGPKPDAALAERQRADRLEHENARLREKLERAHVIIDVQKKLCTLLGLPAADGSDDPK